MKYRTIKNIIDRTLALFGLIIIMPLIILIFLLIKIKLGKPIFLFKQGQDTREDILSL